MNKNSAAENIKNSDKIITIYTDGASSGNPGPGGIGIFMKFKEHEREISESIGHTTNNIAELTAIKRALLELKRCDLPIRLYTDSSYALGILTKRWKAAKNQELVAEIRELLSKFKDIKIIKTKGHAGIAENEKADALATQAIKKAV
jgi:ribonuclease HI